MSKIYTKREYIIVRMKRSRKKHLVKSPGYDMESVCGKIFLGQYSVSESVSLLAANFPWVEDCCDDKKDQAWYSEYDDPECYRCLHHFDKHDDGCKECECKKFEFFWRDEFDE